MIVNDFNILRGCSRPAEADAKPIVHPDAVLTRPVPLEALKAVAGRNAEILKSRGDLQLPQLAAPYFLNPLEPLDSPPIRKRLGIGIPERYDHPT